MKASNGSSDESESPHSDFLLDGLSGAGMYSSWECCCSSSSSKYLRHGQKARVKVGQNTTGEGARRTVRARVRRAGTRHSLLFGLGPFLRHAPHAANGRMIDRVQCGVTLFAEAAVGRRRRDGHRSRRRRRPAGWVERERYLVVRPVVVAMLHGDTVSSVYPFTITRALDVGTRKRGIQWNETRPETDGERASYAGPSFRASRFGADNTCKYLWHIFTAYHVR